MGKLALKMPFTAFSGRQAMTGEYPRLGQKGKTAARERPKKDMAKWRVNIERPQNARKAPLAAFWHERRNEDALR